MTARVSSTSLFPFGSGARCADDCAHDAPSDCVAALLAENTKLRERVARDTLTKALRRGMLADWFERQISKSRLVAIVIIDVDGMKRVNDTHGHPAGDRVLQAISAALRARVREFDGDLVLKADAPDDASGVFRRGGDEFIVGLRDGHAVYDVAARLRCGVEHAVCRLAAADGVAYDAGASMGVALFPDDGLTIEDLDAVADARMYSEKTARKAGR